jgi:hypothetical protein
MFESRYQAAQVCIAVGGLFAVLAVSAFLARSLVLGITCVVVEHAAAALGCALYAAAKGYPLPLGIPIGTGLGVMGAVIIAILPDESVEDESEEHERLSSEGVRNARLRDPGYEVLEDDEDD